MDTENLIKALAKNLLPVKKQESPNVFAIKYLLVMILVITTGVIVLTMRSDIGNQKENIFFIIDTVCNLALLISGVFYIGWFSSAGRPIGSSSKWVIPIIFFFILIFNVYRLSLIPFFFNNFSVRFFDIECFLYVMLFAVISFGIISWSVKKRIVLRPGMLGGVIGLVSFSVGSFILNYHCGVSDHGHITIYHFILPMACGLILGSSVGRLAFRF